MHGTRIPCVGAIVKDDAGRLLLIRRGHEPDAGLWSVPGGRVEPGETDEQALVRETTPPTCAGLVPRTWPAFPSPAAWPRRSDPGACCEPTLPSRHCERYLTG